MKVLFSPVGSTDPITKQRDGGLLHICRIYRPDKVYLYLTAEMCKYNDKDNRYCRALELLGEKIGWKYDIEVIRAEEMVDVQLFDSFIEPFENILDKIIRTDNPEILYVNVSSGTPAMKSALQTISILWNNVEALQVSTPEKASNKSREEKENYDLDFQWEENKDNQPNFESRCEVSHAKRMLDRIRKESICEYIEAYDYEAAKMLANKLSEKPSTTFLKCLDIAIERQKLNITTPALDNYKKYFPIGDWFAFSKDSDIKDFEYLLAMQVKLERKQYVDFCRDITPILFSLSQRLLEKECKLTLDDIGKYNDKQKCYYISTQKLSEKKLWLDDKWKDYKFVSSDVIIQIIEHSSKNRQMVLLLQQLRDAEINVRNKAAHEIVGMSNDDFKKKLGKTPQEIMQIAFRLAEYGGLKIDTEKRNIYKVMNKQLCDMLVKGKA